MDKMTLKDYYHNGLPSRSFPKTEFVNRVAERCGLNDESVRAWIRGDRLPSEDRYYDILSEETGIPKHLLFSDENA